MSKLIYAKTKAGFEKGYSAQDRTDVIDKSLVFIEEGYFWTHGQYFHLFNAEDILLKSVRNDNKVTITDSNKGTVELDIGLYDSTTVGPLSTSVTKGVVTISHDEVLGVETKSGPTKDSNTSIKVPQLIFDKYGHYNSTVERTATLNQVLTTINSSSTRFNLVGSGSDGTTTESLTKSTGITFTGSGDLYARNLYEGGAKLDTIYAPIGHVDVKATGEVLGHVTLSDSTSTDSGAGNSVAATPKAVKAVYDYAKSIISAGDAMIFKGVINAGGVIAGEDTFANTIDKLTYYKAGWTFRVNVKQTLPNFGNLEVGDLIMAIADSTTGYKFTDWTVAQTDIDGAVTSVADLTEGQLILGNGNKTVSAFGLGGKNTYLTSTGSALSWETITYSGLGISGGGTNKGTFKAVGSALKSIDFTNGLQVTGTTANLTVGHSNSITAQTTLALRKVSYDSHGHITGSEIVTTLPTEKSISFSGGDKPTISKTFDGSEALSVKLSVGGHLALNTKHTTGGIEYALSMSNKYRPVSFHATHSAEVTSLLTDTKSNALVFAPGNANMSIKTDSTGKLIFTSVNTWRNVTAYQLTAAGGQSFGTMLSQSIETDDLQFGSEFMWVDSGKSGLQAGKELKLGWAEVNDAGVITYAV